VKTWGDEILFGGKLFFSFSQSFWSSHEGLLLFYSNDKLKKMSENVSQTKY